MQLRLEPPLAGSLGHVQRIAQKAMRLVGLTRALANLGQKSQEVGLSADRAGCRAVGGSFAREQKTFCRITAYREYEPTDDVSDIQPERIALLCREGNSLFDELQGGALGTTR